MKRIAYILLIIMALITSASAYSFTFDVPSKVNRGEDIYIDGSSNLPAGTTMQLALYEQKTSIRELERNSITIQDEGDWSTVFKTSDYSAGTYKIEVPPKYTLDLGSSSVIYRMFEIIDRSLEIIITSPLEQEYTGHLDISGKSTTRGDAGIQLLVEGPYGIVFPKQWISTDKLGIFSESVAIETGGSFDASFYDNKGLVASVNFKVEPNPVKSQQSATVTPTESSQGNVMQAQTFASAPSPAYFSVKTSPGILDIYTSSGKDWIICYVGEDMAEFTVNSNGADSAEKVTIPVEGGMVYVKIYPAEESESGYVTLYAKGASSITVSDQAEQYFNKEGSVENPQTGPEILISLISACIAIIIAGYVVKRQ